MSQEIHTEGAEGAEFDLTYLSLGGGVQSSALLAMSALGLHGVPRADVAIFADTMAETAMTYAWLAELRAWSTAHGIPVVTCSRGDLAKAVLDRKESQIGQIPMFAHRIEKRACACSSETRFPWPDLPRCPRCNGTGQEIVEVTGMTPRHCTSNFKVEPIEKAVREQLGLAKGQRAKGVKRALALIGISRDEAHRVRTSRTEWITNLYPLVDAGLTRTDCETFLRETFSKTPPRSSCYFCPFHSDAYWRDLLATQPAEFEKAVMFDDHLRKSQSVRIQNAYIHRSGKPLAVAINGGETPDGFGNDCSGVCGV